MSMHADVAVIGSGFSSVALSLNLVDVLPATARVCLVGATRKRGRGIAYAANGDCLLLNVPAGRMSLFADRPNHFVDWLAENGRSAAGNDYVPRQLYGRYLGDSLDAALKRTANRAALSLVDAEACSAEPVQDGSLTFRLSDGARLHTDFAVLCTGAGTARLPLRADQLSSDNHPFIVHDPWAEDWLERVPSDGDILLVGTGLTMIDQCLLLKERGFRGTIHAVSRHALLPQAHLTERAEPTTPVLSAGGGEVSEMLAILRAAADAAPDWRAVMDGLRPVTREIWACWSPAQQGRFLRHAATFWNVHRHRMAPRVARGIETLQRSGQLRCHKGRLEAVRRVGRRVEARINARDGFALTTDLVVNCTGFDRCTAKTSPFLASLADQGLIQPDRAGLGIAVDEHSAAIAAGGKGKPRLYAMGPLTAGRHWEITAVPDIRVQARSVAETIGARVSTG
ncbi:FAD-dependent pyridine nucleotide-disulfide oxidoreductase [Shinella kummerowiae]|uniref:FAD-dependent pyridine nucleotide-disulfide oxidoreductase n=1 Tax=Shinella kummerowiae TaxID=417745 RepID=A0A6N8SDW2_9HYPH|nr:FAD/NAD(P)-binding protein [Shinella kummerowiae]MXN45122.1 FAD-dependent pyridine nucleotide-disulfide oxidoreductase [Shinella kummerowiae]